MTPIRPNVLGMKPYPPGKPISEVKRELGLDRVIKLASNENPFGPSPLAIEAVRAAAEEMHHYPDGAAFELREKISQRFGFPHEQILVGNGSDELIHLLGLVILGDPSDEMIVGDPSFARYDASAHLAPSRLVKVPLTADYRHDLPAMARAVTDNTKILWIANPNNPTGTIVRRKEVDAMLADLPERVLVVLDEAYYEFAAHLDEFPTSTDYVKSGRNVIGLRTLSKVYGLAGIRIGFGFGPSYIVDAINRAREPFNVNSLAQIAAVAALDDHEHLRRTVENNAAGVKQLAEAFTKCGASPCESFGNFVYADLGRSARPVYQELLERGVITRSGEIFGNPNCLRVTVGTPEENDEFCAKLVEVLGVC
jgi:histidinol-phosphate aminotransferase